MKTILIPIFHGHIARNILRTRVLSLLAERYRVVLIAPEFKITGYQQEFGGSNIVIEPSPTVSLNHRDRFFRSFYYYFVDTATVKIIQQEQFLLTGRHVRYWWARIWTKIFGHSRWLRRVARWLDQLLVKDNLFAELFDRYQPDLVFIPSITSDDEGLVLRQAKQRGIKTVGMIRSWDNITVNKGHIRVAPDKLLVHTELLKEDVMRYADFPVQRIEVVGLSHFDYYVTGQRIPRGEFFRRVGGVPDKKTIYFMPIGLSDQAQDQAVVGFLEEKLRSDHQFTNVQLMISAHPNTDKPIDYVGAETSLLKFSDPILYPGGKLTDREIKADDMELMASAIYHSDVVVNYQGTTSIDAAAFDKPTINVAFDDTPAKLYLKSVRRFYDFTHYQSVIRSGGVRLAHSQEELFELIRFYLDHPEADNEGRRRLLLEQNGGMLDGKSSQRTASAILSSLTFISNQEKKDV